MILVDTSVWIEFLRKGNDQLSGLLKDGEVATHELVIGELRVGNISGRETFLSLLDELPRVDECSHEEAKYFIEKHKLFGRGIGYLDIHLLCSSVIWGAPLWTLDKRLAKEAEALTSRWT